MNHTGVVPEWLNNKEYLEKVLANHFGQNSLHLEDFAITPGSSLGDNYLCQIFRIELHYTINNRKERKYIIGKYLIKTELTDELTKHIDFFGVEVYAFKNTLPLLYEELKKSIRNAEKFFPELIFIDEPHRIFFMEDLKQNGYQLVDRTKQLDLSHSLLVIKALASLHASSYLLFQKNPDHKNMYLDTLWGKPNEAMVNFIEGSLQCLLKALPKWRLSDEIKEKLRKVNYVEMSTLSYQRKEDSFNVLLHGDCWFNNMMFRQNNGEVESVKLFDYQIMNYNSIGLDLNYFIFSSTMEYVKLNHIDSLLSEYYNTFTSISGEIKGFTLETVQKEFHERLGFGLVIQICSRPAMTAPEAFDIDAQVKKEESAKNEKLYLQGPYVEETIKILPLFIEHGIL